MLYCCVAVFSKHMLRLQVDVTARGNATARYTRACNTSCESECQIEIGPYLLLLELAIDVVCLVFYRLLHTWVCRLLGHIRNEL